MRIDTATLVLPAVESFYGRLYLLHRHAITASLSSLRFACLLIFLHRALSYSIVLFFRRSCRSNVATLSLSTFTSAARLLLTEVNTSLSNWEVTGCDFTSASLSGQLNLEVGGTVEVEYTPH